MNDDDLRDAFRQLRDAEVARVPRFRIASPPRRAPRWSFAFAAVVLLVVIGVAVAVFPIRRRPPVTESIVTWTAPTDVLLRTPGSELLSTTPRIPDISERK